MPQAPSARGEKGQSFLRDLLRPADQGAAGGARCSGVIVLLLLIWVAIFADLLAPYRASWKCSMIDRLQGAVGAPTRWAPTTSAATSFEPPAVRGAGVALGVGFAATTLSVVVSLLDRRGGGVRGRQGSTWRCSGWWTRGCRFPGLLLLLTIMTIVGRGHPADHRACWRWPPAASANSRVVQGCGDRHQGATPTSRRRTPSAARRWRTLLRHVLAEHHGADADHHLQRSTIGVVVIIAEASLSFLGFGLPTGRCRAGAAMLSREGRAVHGDGAAAGDVAGGVR